MAPDPLRQKSIVVGLVVAHVGGDRQVYRLVIETFRGRRAAYASAVLPASVRGDLFGAIGGASREEPTNTLRKARHEEGIEFGTARGLSITGTGPRLRVVEALGLGVGQGRLLDQQSLALISPARATPFQHDSGECGVLPGAPRESGIT